MNTETQTQKSMASVNKIKDEQYKVDKNSTDTGLGKKEGGMKRTTSKHLERSNCKQGTTLSKVAFTLPTRLINMCHCWLSEVGFLKKKKQAMQGALLLSLR